MLDLLKRIIIFGIGIYAIMFFGKLFFVDFSFSSFTADLKGAAEDIHSIGQIGRNDTSSKNYSNSDHAQSSPIVTSAGSESAITVRNISRGNIVAPGDIIDGSAPASWFYENISTAQFYDNQEKLLGTAQMKAQADTNKGGLVPFTVVAQFNQSYAETGYVVFKKANVGGVAKNDAHFAFPITYPVKNIKPDITSTLNTNTQIIQTSQNKTATVNTSSSDGLAAPTSR